MLEMPQQSPGAAPWTKLDEKVKRVWRWGAFLGPLFFLVPGLGIAFAIERKRDLPVPLTFLVVGAYVLIAIISFVLVDKKFDAWRYRITEEDIATRSGIFWRNKRYVGRHRVQHVDVTAGPIQRALGLAEIKVYVAGGEAASIPGLTEHEAERIRQTLLRQDKVPPMAPAPPLPPQGL
jgi:membrane protein YdbS with pleckstrin-like domain